MANTYYLINSACLNQLKLACNFHGIIIDNIIVGKHRTTKVFITAKLSTDISDAKRYYDKQTGDTASILFE